MSQTMVAQLKEAEQLLATVISILSKKPDSSETTLSAKTLKKRLTELQRLREELHGEVEQAAQQSCAHS